MNKTVLITGASRGLGKELAQAFAAQGDNLILTCKESLIYDNYPGIICNIALGDLAEEETHSKLYRLADKRGLDILIHNAGIHHAPCFASIQPWRIKKEIEVNLIAPIMLTKMLWPLMQYSRTIIVFINSLAGKQGADGETIYCASKHGLAGFARALQFDAMKIGVKVISIFMGAMKTDMTSLRPDWDKLIDPQEAAHTIVSLCENYETLRITEVEIGRTNY